MLQLFREQMIDPWTIWDQFDVPDAGPMPSESVPERIAEAKRMGIMQGPPPEQVNMNLQLQMAQLQQQLMQIQQMMQQPPPGAAPPGPGGPGAAPPEGAPPPDGGGGPKGQQGRPPSGQVPPHLETRDNGTRPIVAES